jgi:hypothetical protein
MFGAPMLAAVVVVVSEVPLVTGDDVFTAAPADDMTGFDDRTPPFP